MTGSSKRSVLAMSKLGALTILALGATLSAAQPLESSNGTLLFTPIPIQNDTAMTITLELGNNTLEAESIQEIDKDLEEVIEHVPVPKAFAQVYIVGTLYTFVGIAMVCEEYFVASINMIIQEYKISPDVAGATLMAAGSSSPELFAATIGVFLSTESSTGIGTVVGSAVFNILVIIGGAIIVSNPGIDLEWRPILRDAFFYAITLLILYLVLVDGIVTMWEALAMNGVYFLYIICNMYFGKLCRYFCPVGGRCCGMGGTDLDLDEELGGSSGVDNEAHLPNVSIDRTPRAKRVAEKMNLGVECSSLGSNPAMLFTYHRQRVVGGFFGCGTLQHLGSCGGNYDGSSFDSTQVVASRPVRTPQPCRASPPQLETDANSALGANIFRSSEPATERTLMGAGLFRCSTPARKVSPIKVELFKEEESANPIHASAVCSGIDGADQDYDKTRSEHNNNNKGGNNNKGLLPTAEGGHSWGHIMEHSLVIIGYPLALMLRATVVDCQEEKWRKYYWLTFFQSIVWLAIFVYFMLHMAEAAADILEIDPTVVGLTVCAIGTSAPDALASLYVAREGQGTMAVANAFGSNIFDILFGLGLPFLLSTLISGAPLQVETDGILSSTILLAGMLVAFLVWISLLKCSLHKNQGWLLIGLYVAYIVAVTQRWL
jgi:K+-dependent Na+/Ca+ exchanger-like protein